MVMESAKLYFIESIIITMRKSLDHICQEMFQHYDIENQFNME